MKNIKTYEEFNWNFLNKNDEKLSDDTLFKGISDEIKNEFDIENVNVLREGEEYMYTTKNGKEIIISYEDDGWEGWYEIMVDEDILDVDSDLVKDLFDFITKKI